MAAFLNVQNGNCKYDPTQVVRIKSNNMSDGFENRVKSKCIEPGNH